MKVLQNVLPDDILMILRERLKEMSMNLQGSTTFYVPFLNRSEADAVNAVEWVILNIIAPTLFGSLVRALYPISGNNRLTKSIIIGRGARQWSTGSRVVDSKSSNT